MTKPTYSALTLSTVRNAPLGYTDYVALGLTSLYGRTYPTAAKANLALARIIAALGATAQYTGYVSLVPSGYPTGRTVLNRIRLRGGLTLLLLYPLTGEDGITLGVLTRGKVPRLTRRGSTVALSADTALGAGYVTVLRATRGTA